jgi:type I restriction enzyme S subunit
MTHTWPKVRLKFAVDKIGSGKTPLGGATTYISSGIMLLRSQNIHFDGLRLEDVVFIDVDTDAQMASTRVQPDDVLLNITGASLGRCTIAPKDISPANVNQHVCILRPNKKHVEPRFLNMTIQSAPIQRAIFVGENGSSREGLTFEQVGNFEIVLPPLPDQQAIADYLDRETARLDGLVAAKERVLELLAEKGRALITSAVTRGLDPHAPLRNSGIPWLGEIPSHWEIERTRWLFRERDERSETGEEELLTVSHLTGVTPRSAKDVNMFEAETTEGYKICLVGDLVINTLWAWMGAMGTSPVNGIVSPAYNVYQPGPRLDPSFVDALVRIPVFAQEVTRYSKGVWSSRLRLYPEGFFEVFFAVPPISEQRAIVAQITAETANLDALRTATERTIALLKERRSALVAAAVTGQIEVEGVACS